ncbi:MAG TPA: hypothetical protein VNK70_02900 [Candidatus Paceibacterota bacterium]|nr:hypothetical protein [Candidatus Paceibacterota bacterium]
MLSSIIKGAASGLLLLAVYFTVVSLISGWDFALNQFSRFWYFIIGLALGFGIQIGLYSYLRAAVNYRGSKSVVAVSGTTSTVAMISCCAHYLANILPFIGAAGVISLISQYQIQLFWVGLVFNIVGIAYIGRKIVKFRGL